MDLTEGLIVGTLIRPGDRVVVPGDPDLARELEAMAREMIAGLDDACVCLNLLGYALTRLLQQHQESSVEALAAVEGRWAEIRRIEAELNSQLDPTLSEEERAAALERNAAMASQQAWIEQRRAAGMMPTLYEHRIPHIHARDVVLGLDRVAKALGVLAGVSSLTAALTPLVDEWNRRLPGVKAIRDSAHHLEDRARGLDRKGKKIAADGYTGSTYTVAPGTMVISGLFDNQLHYTAGDGTQAVVEMSEDTVAAAADVIQAALNVLTWEGPPELIPS